MHEEGLDIQGAIDRLERHLIGVVYQWYTQWVGGNVNWTFASGRYFEDEGLEVQKTRVVSLLPSSKGFVGSSA